MALAAVPMFYDDVESWLDRLVFLIALVLMIWAFIHAAVQRPEAFAAIGGLQKPQWLGLLAGLLLVGALLYLIGLPIFLYVGIGAAAYYLLETRRGLKDVSEGSW